MLRAYYQDFHALVASLPSMNILSYLLKDLIGAVNYARSYFHLYAWLVRPLELFYSTR